MRFCLFLVHGEKFWSIMTDSSLIAREVEEMVLAKNDKLKLFLLFFHCVIRDLDHICCICAYELKEFLDSQEEN